MASNNSGWDKVAKGLLPPVVQCLRDVAQDFPRLNQRGRLVVLPKGRNGRNVVGTAARKAMSDDQCSALDELSINNWIKRNLPNSPIYYLPSAESLAEARITQGGYQQEYMDQAAACFRIPDETKVLFIGPEYTFRRQLWKDEKWALFDDQGNTTGIAPPCPWCSSNKSIKFQCFEVSNKDTMPRAICNLGNTCTFLFGVRYDCISTACVGRLPKVDKEKEWNGAVEQASSHSFVSWNPRLLKMLPKEQQRVYLEYASGLFVEDDALELPSEPQTLPSPALALQLLDNSRPWSKIESNLQEQYDLVVETCVASYQRFVRSHKPPTKRLVQTTLTGGSLVMQNQERAVTTWPMFQRDKFAVEFAPPQNQSDPDHVLVLLSTN